MCKKFEIAKEVIYAFIDEQKPFTFEEIQDAIINKGGVLRIAPGITIGEYLKNLEEREILFYNTFIDKFDYLSIEA